MKHPDILWYTESRSEYPILLSGLTAEFKARWTSLVKTHFLVLLLFISPVSTALEDSFANSFHQPQFQYNILIFLLI